MNWYICYSKSWNLVHRKLAWVWSKTTSIEFQMLYLTELLSHELNSNSKPALYSYSSFIYWLVFRFYFSHSLHQLPHLPKSKSCTINNMSIAQWIDNRTFNTEGFLDVAIESWPKWFWNLYPMNSVTTL